MTTLRRLARGDRGAVAVEFAFVLPLVMLFFVASVQVGMAVLASASGTNAAREAARVATVRYECADNHVSARCPLSPSTNYTTIKAAAIARLGGVIPSASVTVTVQCRQSGSSGPVISCEKSTVTPDQDVVVVTVGWNNLAASKYVPMVARSSTAVMSINGRPDLTSLAPEPDGFPPALATTDGLVAKDSNADGILDKVELTFDEDITQSVSTSVFTLSGSPTGSNTITSAVVSGRVVTLTLTGSTVGTATTGMTLALSASASGITDSSGNQGTFNATAVADKAGPRLIGISDTNGLVNGKMELLDSVIFTFSEPIGIGLGVTTVTESGPSGSGNDSIEIAGITAGPQLTNSNSYVSNATPITVVGAAVAVGNTVVVSLTTSLSCLPLCLSLGTGNDASDFNMTVSTSLGDAAGNVASGTGTISRIF